MKKTFTILIAAIAAIMLITQPRMVWGQEKGTDSYQFTFKSVASGNDSGTAFSNNVPVSNVIDEGTSYVSAIPSTNNVYLASPGNGIKFGNNSTNGKITFTLSNTGSVTATKIKVNARRYNSTKASKIKITITDTNNSTSYSTIDITSGSFDDYEWTLTNATAIKSINLEGQAGASGDRRIYVKSVTVTYTTGGGTTTNPTITFNNGSVNVGKTLDLSTKFTSNSSGAVTYSITAGDSYATLSGSILTGVAEGSVTVKASQAEAGSYNAGEATATITVNAAPTLSSIAITTPPTKITYTEGEFFDATGMVVTATYSDATTDDVTASCTFTPSGALATSDDKITVSYTEGGVTKTAIQAITVNEYVQPTEVAVNMNYEWLGSTNGGNLSDDQLPVVKDEENITITITKGTSTNPRGDTDYIRVYKGSTITFEAPTGYNLTEIVFTTGGNNTWTAPGASIGTLSSKTWTGEGAEVTFTLSGSCFIASTEITLALPKVLSSISLSGTYPTTFHVGDAFSHEGMTVTATYNDASTKDVTADATFSGYNMSTTGNQTVTVSYTEGGVTKTATYGITVNAPATLTSITLSGTYPTIFTQGDAFSHEGMTITANYDDASTKDVTADATFSGYNMSTTGNQTVTVSYTESGVTKTANYTITVNEIPNKTIAQFISAGGGKCYLTGTVSNIANTTYGNFDLTDESGTIYVYGCLTSAGVSAQFSTLGIEENDVIKVLANVYEYYNNTTHEAKNVKFVEEIVPNPQTLTVNATNGSVEITGKTLDNGSCEVNEGASVTATATPANHYTFTSWTAEGITLANATVNPLTFTMPTNDVTLTASFTENAKYNATFYVLGGISGTDSNVYEGDAITFPSVTAPNGYTFMGWTTSSIDGIQDDAPNVLVNSANMGNANIDYYAVFAIQTGGGSADTYSLVEDYDDLNDGDIVVLYSTGSYTASQVVYNFSKANAGIGGNNNDIFTDVDVTVSNNQFTSSDVVPMTLVKSNTSWKLKIGNQFVSAKDKGVDLDNTGSLNTITISDGIATIKATINSTNYNLQYNPNSGNGRFAYYKSTQKSVSLYKQNTPIYSSYCTTVSGSDAITGGSITNNELTGTGTIAANTAVSITSLTIKKDAILIVNGVIATDNPANLIIEDGAQLILANTNANVKATVKKSITAAVVPNSKAGEAPFGWYSISSSVNNAIIAGEGANTNLITTTAAPYDFDLYRYNETASAEQWENYHANNDFTHMTNGRGYLYRNANSVTIEFTGTVNTGNITYNVTKSEVGTLSGFNLIGNPYTHDIYKGTGGAINDSKLNEGFYVATNSGSWTACTDNTTPIEKNQGILVQANTDGETEITITNVITGGPSAKANHDNIKFMVSNSQYEDVAYAMFDKGNGLNKISHRNAEIPMLYIPQNDENYAIAMMDDNTQAFNLNFKAMTMGKYTLSYKANGQFSYLHVIDRLTGEDVDMLLEESYSFVGTPKDAENRFIVKLNYQSGLDSSDNSTFAYQSGNDIIVSGEGELQIFDVMGRMIATQNINGVETVNVPANGVYVFRLNEKVQKVVVK